MNQNDTLPLIKGRIESSQPFRNPRGGSQGQERQLPQRTPAEHRDYLLHQLDDLQQRLSQQGVGDRVEGADRQLIAVEPEQGSELSADGLADKRLDVRLVAVDEETGTALIDVPRSALEMPHLRRKASDYADETKRTRTGRLRNEPLVAPISRIDQATREDLSGPKFREAPVTDDEPHWLEISCRGGSTSPQETVSSRIQILEVASALGLTTPQEYEAPELLLVYLRLTMTQLAEFIRRTDCIYEFDLLSKDLRTWVLLEAPAQNYLEDFELTAPPPDGPAVVLLDSGITPNHPLLRSAVLSATSSVPTDPSPVDLIGHGTEMAGVALYDDLGQALDEKGAAPNHWIQSSRILAEEGRGTASEENRPYWPATTRDGVHAAESSDAEANRRRAFVLAVSSESDQGRQTTWSTALDELAFNAGDGRLIFAAIGNVEVTPEVVASYPQGNVSHFLDDPAQAENVVTVGGATFRCELPPGDEAYIPIAPEGGISPHARAGLGGRPIKPEIVLEAGNQAFDGSLVNRPDTMTELTTGHRLDRSPLSVITGTSAAAATAGRLSAEIWTADQTLRPETVRGLLIHSASWTETMLQQLPNLDQRLLLCGYGVPNLEYCLRCTRERATIVVEDRLPNAVPAGDGKFGRLVKYFRFPGPDFLQELRGTTIELTVTLSYFSQPSLLVRNRVSRGLSLQWDMQGPAETEQEFMRRVNLLERQQPVQPDNRTQSYSWMIGIQRRSRGTVQRDTCVAEAALFAGPRLIAVYPTLGWWDQRDELKQAELPFSLLVSLRAPEGIDVYTPIVQQVELTVDVPST